MTPPTLLPLSAPPAEPAWPSSFDVMTWNVLLPNNDATDEGWWVTKYYDAATDPAHRAWSHRRGLLREVLVGRAPDIACVQEVAASTFAEDFAFMAEAGYAHALHRKYWLRNATFWRDDRWEHVLDKHKDRVLITLLRQREEEGRLLYVINCHLTAAPQPDRRFRQLFEALDQVRKEQNKLGLDPAEAAVVVCGDFNCDPVGAGTDRLLREGEVGPELREPRWPEQPVTSKRRGQAFGPFEDLGRAAFGAPMPTLVVTRLSSCFTKEGLTPRFFEALGAMFRRFAGEAEVMDEEAVAAWVARINGDPSRGSERRKADAVFAEKGELTLTQEELLGIYVSELQEGKFWSVQHDLQVCEVAPPGEVELFEASLDRIYVNRSALRGVAVREPLTEAQRGLLYEARQGLPNAWHPSDHLPVLARVAWR